jgi:hypothetical protein
MFKSRYQNDVLSASEIGQFVYCSVAWYLQKCGYKPKSFKLDVGLKKHKKMGNALKYVEINSRKTSVLKNIGYLFLVASIFFILLEVTI